MKKLITIIASLAIVTGCLEEESPTAVLQTPTNQVVNQTGQPIHAMIVVECNEVQGAGTERVFSDSATIANGSSHTFHLNKGTPNYLYVTLVNFPNFYMQTKWVTPDMGDKFVDTLLYRDFDEIQEGYYVGCPTGWQN